MIISFSLTKDRLLQGHKTATRRMWKDSHARKFKRGDLVDAWDKLPFASGRKIATIRIQKPPYREALNRMTLEDVAQEGFEGLTVQEFVDTKWVNDLGGSPDDRPWVVRFNVTSVYFWGRIIGDSAGARRMKTWASKLPLLEDRLVVAYGEGFADHEFVRLSRIDRTGGQDIYVFTPTTGL